MKEFLKMKNLLNKRFAFVVLVVVFTTIGIFYFASNNHPTVKSQQELAIENTGLPELDAKFNASSSNISPQEKALAQQMMDAAKLAGDGKDTAKIQQSTDAISKIIANQNDYSDAYFQRAEDSLLLKLQYHIDDIGYQKIIQDVDNAIKYWGKGQYAIESISHDSSAPLYVFRAKVDMLSGNKQQAIADLQNAINNSKANKVIDLFYSGETRNEVNADPTTFHQEDFDSLVAQYPDDYRVYMWRGLFYAYFTTLDEQAYAPTLDNLKQALKVNPDSALVNYLIGSIYQKGAFWTKAAWADVSQGGGYRDKAQGAALPYFQEAIKLDPNFVDAYNLAAESLFELRRYSDAIPYYDKVIQLDPTNFGDYNDRGLAKVNLNDYYAAISDFSEAINLKESSSTSSLDSTYESRGDAYMKVADYGNAISDYSGAIGVVFARQVLLMSIPQIRSIYPELNAISDQDLLEGFRQKYFPNMSSVDFANNYQSKTSPFEDFILAGLYAKRGDAYVATGNLRKAAGEYSRALHDDSTYIFDRWKTVSKTPGTTYFVDIQTLDFTHASSVSLWVKALDNTTQSYDETNYQIDCSQKKIKSVSATRYDFLGNPGFTTPEQNWQGIIPETFGEFLYNEVCKN